MIDGSNARTRVASACRNGYGAENGENAAAIGNYVKFTYKPLRCPLTRQANY